MEKDGSCLINMDLCKIRVMVMRYENINGANLINPKYKLIIAVVWQGKTTLHIVQVHINSLLISKLCTIAKYLAGQWQIHRITHFQC